MVPITPRSNVKIESHQATSLRGVHERESFANDMQNNNWWWWIRRWLHMIYRWDLFSPGWFFNRQNCWFWGTENPDLCVARPLRSQKLTVWIALSSKGFIYPFFLPKKIHYWTVRCQFRKFLSPCYRATGDRPGTSWFLQDCAPLHPTPKAFCFLEDYFGAIIIAVSWSASGRTGKDWRPYSSNITPATTTLWVTLKDICFCGITLQHLRNLNSWSMRRVLPFLLIHYSENFIPPLCCKRWEFRIACGVIATAASKGQFAGYFLNSVHLRRKTPPVENICN